MYKQKPNYFEAFFNETLCVFRKTNSTQHASFELLTA